MKKFLCCAISMILLANAYATKPKGVVCDFLPGRWDVGYYVLDRTMCEKKANGDCFYFGSAHVTHLGANEYSVKLVADNADGVGGNFRLQCENDVLTAADARHVSISPHAYGYHVIYSGKQFSLFMTKHY